MEDVLSLLFVVYGSGNRGSSDMGVVFTPKSRNLEMSQVWIMTSKTELKSINRTDVGVLLSRCSRNERRARVIVSAMDLL